MVPAQQHSHSAESIATNIQIHVSNLLLRRLQKKDIPAMTKYLQNPNISRYTSNIPYPYTEENARWFVRDSHKQWRNGTNYVFGILYQNQFVGVCSLTGIKERHAELGYWLAEPFWGKGITSTAAHAVVQFGFEKLHLHRLHVSHFAENKASERIIKKLGFILEGTEREHFLRHGKWHNILNYGLLEQEWLPKQQELKHDLPQKISR